MSFQSLADVFAYVQTHDNLTSSEVLVLTAIAHHTDRTGAQASPTQPTLEKNTKLTARAIRYTLRSLEGKKLLETKLTRGKPGRQTYRLLLPHVCIARPEINASLPPPRSEINAGLPPPRPEIISGDPGNSKKGENPAHARDDGHAREDWSTLPGEASRVGITPGSVLWHLMTTPPTPKAG
jgi:hypothetical protein